jgi:hypothetical protein
MAKVLLKKSSVSSNAPGIGDLEYGEVAINYADGRLYYKNSSNIIKNFIDSDLIIGYIDYIDSLKVDIDGDIMTGTLDMGGNKIARVADPVLAGDATNKGYVDAAVAAGAGAINFPSGNYGMVDSDLTLDAFGIAITGDYYDMLTEPANSLGQVDFGSDSSI